ncbi:DNA-3-methyladenine glycosylase family protein [Candidatus Methylobacter oryzae]|uniref:DNA-3-methyladenine glycosylase II n=1 Tax=Candidatus Methylobacter oryzae TaxID=2497749 RepID=A0ABY3CGW6_9GAMM|nr:AlkA N-terminal domain-containing protein [Candidatus Methylobacter oryzae]TRX03028.1 DNA-3-methyladenine glycosylase 2 [Candidatus Methylobacter oryzae]
MNTVNCSLPLPDDFRPDDMLKFHQRDVLAVAERVDAGSLSKGILWNGSPACLSIRFETSCAQVELAINGIAVAGDAETLRKLGQRMLGLDQSIEEFEQRYRDHPQLGILIAGQSGLRVPVTASIFEALSWAIICQQISVRAAVAIRRKLIQLAALRYSGGLYCYPDARHVADFSESDLRQAGFSQSKARCLLAVSRMIAAGDLELEYSVDELPVDRVCEQLLRIRGIGPWTVNYALLRGFGWLDGSLHGDIAVRRGLQKLLAIAEPVGEQQARQWLAPFSPWRALVAVHLWTFLAALA